MRSKILALMFVSLFLVGVVSASCDGYGANNLGTFKQGESVELQQTCDSCTYVNLSSVIYPNSSTSYSNAAMTKNGIEFNYTFSNTTDLGDYLYKVFGDKDGVTQSETFCFSITPSGDSLDEGKAKLYSILMIAFFILFIATTFIAWRIPMDHHRDEDNQIVSLNKLRYVKPILFFFAYILFVFFFGFVDVLAGSYFSITWIASTFSVIEEILLIGILPAFIIVAWNIIVEMVASKELKEILAFRSGI